MELSGIVIFGGAQNHQHTESRNAKPKITAVNLKRVMQCHLMMMTSLTGCQNSAWSFYKTVKFIYKIYSFK